MCEAAEGGIASLASGVEAKRQELAALRKAIRPDALDDVERGQRIDITFTSNALEGNTLSAGETALVLEKGITVSGKPLKDHLEAVDHAKALDWVLEVAAHETLPLTEADIRNLHRLVVATSRPEIAGQYADRARFVNTDKGLHEFPAPVDVPALMRHFIEWLGRAQATARTAFDAHRKLVAIHPFNDGNGRTARLLMNLILARAGYPPIAIRPEDRAGYLQALETDQRGGGQDTFDRLMLARLDATLDLYIAAARQARPPAGGAPKR